MRGPYKPSEYGKVILPFTVLRRLDCVLEPTKAAVLEEKAHREAQGLDPEPFMLRKAGQLFCNGSAMDLKKLKGDPDKIPENLRSYINAFSAEARDIFNSCKFDIEIDKLDESDLLYLVTEKFSKIDLHPDKVSNFEMGIIFEELIRKLQSANDDAATSMPREE